MSSTGIPLGDAATFWSGARAVRRLQIGATVVAVVAATVCIAASLRTSPTTTSLLPSSSTGIVVLDVSASISSDTYARIKATLDRLIASNGAYGLVLFSDTAYQALPPNTPARELKPISRFFDLGSRTSPGALPQPPPSPFTGTFSFGTRISSGLSLALEEIREQRLVDPAVLLVSDLQDDPNDLERVAGVAISYRQAGIPLHVVGLNADPEDVAFIRRLAPGKGTFSAAALPSERAASESRSVDPLLIGGVVLLALGLTTFLLLTAPLRFGDR